MELTLEEILPVSQFQPLPCLWNSLIIDYFNNSALGQWLKLERLHLKLVKGYNTKTYLEFP